MIVLQTPSTINHSDNNNILFSKLYSPVTEYNIVKVYYIQCTQHWVSAAVLAAYSYALTLYGLLYKHNHTIIIYTGFDCHVYNQLAYSAELRRPGGRVAAASSSKVQAAL